MNLHKMMEEFASARARRMEPGAKCPSCSAILDSMLADPVAGAPAICVCGALLVFTEALDVRLLDEADRQRLNALDPELLQELDEASKFFRLDLDHL